jgi:hypothetical protein
MIGLILIILAIFTIFFTAVAFMVWLDEVKGGFFSLCATFCILLNTFSIVYFVYNFITNNGWNPGLSITFNVEKN